MPFGKYRGWLLRNLPDDYFAWLASLDLRDPLRAGVAAERERRAGRTPDPRVVEDLIAAGQRALTRRAPSDVGDSDAHLLAVRTAADWLHAHAAQLRRMAA
jgi:hypothetical protein